MIKITKENLQELIVYLQTKSSEDEDFFINCEANVQFLLNSLEVDEDYMSNYNEIDENEIESMSLNNLKTMYTYIRRGERFCTGYIEGCVKDGTILALAKRHLQLLDKGTRRVEK